MTKPRRNKKTLLILLALVILMALAQFWFFTHSDGEPGEPPSYVVARDPTWFPYDFMGKERQVAAFSDELLRAIASTEKIRIQIYGASSNALFAGLDNDSYEGVLTPAEPRRTAGKPYLYSNPYYRFGPVLVVRKNAAINNLKQLKGSAIGVLRGIYTQLDGQENGADYTFIPYDNVLIALQHLSEGVVDGAIIDTLPAYAYTQSIFTDKLKIATPPLTEEGLRLVVSHDKEGTALLSRFTEGLQKLKSDGTYNAILKKWGLFDPEFVQNGAKAPEVPLSS